MNLTNKLNKNPLTFFATALAMGIFGLTTSQAQASISLDVIPHFNAGAFSASWLHSGTVRAGQGTDRYLGTDANGPRKSGQVSNRLSGGLNGDWNGFSKQLTGITGEISSNISNIRHYGAFTDHANSLAGISSITGDDLLKIVIHDGGLALETTGPGEFTGGWLNYEILVDDLENADGFVSVTEGNFFFKPQAEARGSDLLSPNRGTINEFTVWGNNWNHDGLAAGSFTDANQGDAADSDWDFLSGLGYTGGFTNRADTHQGIDLGIDLFVASQQFVPPVPEPASMMVWGSLIGMFTIRRSRRRPK